MNKKRLIGDEYKMKNKKYKTRENGKITNKEYQEEINMIVAEEIIDLDLRKPNRTEMLKDIAEKQSMPIERLEDTR